jgi:hypothetical protein
LSLQDEKLLGLTIWNPWADLIARGLKTIENRRWPPYDWMLGRYLAIHASRAYDDHGADFIRRNHPRFAVDPPLPAECKLGVIAVARLVGWVRRGPEPDQRPREVKMLVGHAFGAQLDALGHSVDWRWFHGAEYGWVLRDVVRIEPVAAVGRQKVWRLPPTVYGSVRRRYDIARKATSRAA